MKILPAQAVTLRSGVPDRTAGYAESQVRPRVGGIIRTRPFNEGASVKAGQTLYQVPGREPG
ncbi:MAG: hypothetical protein ABIT36_06060 [Steroidobacteraceae bacterium]